MKKIMPGGKLLICAVCLLFPGLLLAADAPVAPEPPVVSAAGRDGSSFDKAVIIKYIGDYQKSIDQEYAYIDGKFGAEGLQWSLVEQSLVFSEDNRSYDKMVIERLPEKDQIVLYFDITEPFAQLSGRISAEQEK